ncbi:PBECR2 nuclease fold domain-containing protein [Helicobacter cinaedi]|uniref:Tetrahydrofolate dehydrogenase/cyclohydrolase, NAD(P)-binding domain protein n=3 Tax=Helicobacter cinaedi TaxID=213 RepID=A0A377JWA7_9HELI|nr:PBECR2 nuclease fold domain-containing protein [Helicobacter cinaedi]STP13748.1 tetrahydrofolate dehydrogenase/cyclohydrolase, NAD(P)-binding domain protein [Helicobacter cinaedi]
MAIFNFDKLEQSNQNQRKNLGESEFKSQSIDFLRKNPTNIQWEQIDSLNLPKEQQYDYIKQNLKVEFDLDNATNKGLYGHRAEWDLNKKANEFKEKYTNKGFLNDVSKNIQGVISTFGYESDDIKELIKDTDELALFVKRAGKDVENIPHYSEIKEYLNLGLNAKKNFFEVADDLVSDLTRPSKEVAKELGLKNDLHLSQAEKGLQDELKAFALYEEIKETQNQSKEVILSKEQMDIIENDLGFFSTLFKDSKEKQNMFMDIQRAREQTNNYVKLSKSLENVLKDEQFFGLLSNAESLSQKQQEKIKNFESVAEFLGFEAVAYNKNGLYFIKDERAYKVEQNFNQELLGVLNDNKGSFGLGIAGAMQGAKKGASAKARFGNMVLYGAGGAFFGGALDSLLVDAKLNKDFDIAQALIHGSQEAGLNIAGDLVFKGISTTYKAIKGGMVKTDKGLGLLKEATNQAKLALSGQNMGAIDRALSKQAKKDEIPLILKSFQESQSDELIKKDFQNESLTEKILNKVSAYAPKALKKTNEPSSLAQKRQELLSTALRNKDLADSLAGQLDDVEARILSEASNKMAKDFKALSQSYENLIAKEVLKNEANPSLPKVFQRAVELAEHNVKTQYAQSVAKLESTLKDKSIDLLTPFKNVADYAIREFGANAEISRALINEVNNLQGRNITIKEALEKRKDINAIIRNYNDNPNALKKFRFQDNALELKNAIDTQIHNTIESGIAKGELDTSARAVLEEFREANIAYADIKQRLNDKLTKAIFMNQPKKSTINSMRSVDEWKKAVLDKQWQDSIVGLENTIFAKFDPRMQEHTQTLLIFRSLERHIKEKDGSTFIDLSKALKDIEQLESLPLHPKAQNALNIFKELALTYEFMQKLSGAKGFKSGAGNGALSTTLEGRMQVFMTNRLFKALFFRVPYIGDKDALLHHLKKAVQELKYPRAITLDMLQNPKATSPNPKSPSNPNGEAYINENVAKDIQNYVSNPQILTDELKHRAKSYALQNALTPPSDESILKAINDDTLIYTTIGNGKISKEQVEKLKEVVESGGKAQNKIQLRQATKEILNTLKNKEITHKNGIVARVSSVGIEKMMSDKAIQKSLDNGFSISQHFNAVQNIETLFKNSDFLRTEAPKNQSKDIVGVHRYINTENLQEQNAQALITLKESVENGNRIYSLELEELTHPTNLNRSPKSKGVEDSHHDDAGATNTARLFENPNADSTTNNLKWQQDGNVLRSVVELDNGEKLLLSKDRLENVYIQSNHIEQVNSYDELILQESLEKFAKDELENKLAKQIESISQFGENYPQFYHKAHEAIQHLLHTKSGQVQGAFHRKELGDIDLVWGNEKIGLQKIVDKHLNDFTDFKGNNPYEKMSNAINEIVENGKLLTENGVNTLYLQKDNKTFLVGLSKGWHNKGDNQWIITSYEAKNLKADMLEKIGANKTISADESLNALQTFNATDKNIIPQKSNKAGIAKLDSAQIQSQMQKEAQAQQEMAEYFAQAQAKKDEMIALKEARLGKNADEVPLDKGQDIPYKPLRDTSIVLSDELPPFEAEFAVVRLSDIKPNFDNSNTQGRLIKQESVIANIVNDFKPELMFYQEGGVNGVPIITRDGKVVSGNHRSEALKQIIDSHNNATQAAREQYKKSAKEFLGVDLQDNEIIVRRLKENMSDKQILQLAFSSNIGRESTMGEKALSTLSLYRQNIATLPKLLQSENVNELKSLVAKHIDKQGNGLNTFDTNLALLTSLARNGKNSNILQSLDSIKGNSEYKNKIINMYVDNAGSFYNLAHNPSFKNLEFRDILSDSIYYTAKQNPTRQLDYEYLIQEIESFLNLAKDKQALKNALVLDSNKVQNLTAQAFGLALAKFSRQENPSSALYEALKQAPKALELATQPTFFTQGKALSEVDIYDFLEYLINQGQITQSQSVLSSLMPRLRELRESIANPQSSVSKVESSIEATSQISKEIKDIIDSSPQKGRDMQIIGEANFTPQVVEYAHKNNKKVAIDKLSQAEAEQLGYKYPNDVRVTIDYSAINHTLNRHGAESALVKNSGQKAVDYTDIAEYRNIVKGADESLDSVDNMGTPVVVSYKQINGHFVVVEEIRKGQNELNFKTMFKQEGNYKDSESYKKTSQSSNATEGYEPTANSFALTKKGYKPDLPTLNNIIPQNPTKAQTQYFNSLTNEYEKIKEIKKLHTQDDVLVRVMKLNDRYIEPLSNMSVSKEYLQKQTAQSLKENITQAILGNQTQLKALQQGYNTYHLSSFQKEVLESALDIANNPTKLKEYKLQGLQKQLDNLNSNEAYHIEKGGEYDKARYAKDRQELEKEISALKGTESSLESAPQKVESSDIIFTDKKGKEHTLTKEVQEQWFKTFNLKSLDESYTPQLPQELQEAIGKEIKLTKGSLYKIVEKGREQYIPQIKETLEKPDFALKDSDDMLIIAKEIGDKQYFTSINLETNDYFISISNAPKKENILKNKVENGAEVVYQSPNAKSIFYTDTLLQEGKSPTNKIDSDIIPQMPKDNPQLVALQTKIQQSRQQIAESKNPDKEYLYQVFKPDEIIELEKQYFNQAMPQEYKEIIQDFPRLYEQSLANELKTYAKDTDTIQEVTTQLLNDFKDKPFKNTAKHAELLLFNTLRDKAQELGFKEMDINTPSFKVAFGKFQARLKKGDIQDLSEHIATSSLRKNRLRIEQSLNIKPLAEFGTNYAEHYHSGESAIAKLLNEKQGQVSGAFYRKELGDIDLVWGDSNFGLKHILDKHGSEFKDIAKELDEIIQNGEVVKTHNGYNITLGDYKVGLNIGWNENGVKIGENKWVVTAFDNSKMQSEKQGSNSASFTKGETLPLNSSDIIPQQTLESTMQKFNYDERKAKDLLEWHKDSSPLTKDENGLPKAENMLESSNKILGETMTLKDRLLIDNKIKYSYLKEIAQDLPKPITKDDFLHLLKNKKYVNIQTPIKELEIEPFKAYEHLTQNSNKQNRIDISGAILPTLQNPLFITKDKKDTYYFYKPFKDEKGVLNIVSIAIPKSNRIRYKTSYIASRERMLKMINEYELVYEAF